MSAADRIRATRPELSNHRLEPGCTQTSVEIGRLRRRQFGRWTSTPSKGGKLTEPQEETPAHLRGDDSANRRVMRELFDHSKLPMKPPGK